LKEIRQVYINWKAKKRYLQTIIDAVGAYPRSPLPASFTNLEIKMKNYFPRIKGLIPKIFLFFPSGVSNFCYAMFLMWTDETSLGLLDPYTNTKIIQVDTIIPLKLY